MPATYEKIATTTLGSAASDITFSTIPGTYTDLKIILTGTTSAAQQIYLQFNADTATNYSSTLLAGNGTTAFSGRQSTSSFIRTADATTTSTTIPTFYSFDIFSYAGSTNKTALVSVNGSGYVYLSVGLWRSTSAITSIKVYPAAGTFSAGTIATLYGILKA
jgi:hypothetical protein